MKKILVLLCVAVSLYSCKVVEVMQTKPSTPGIRIENNVYVYENDTLQVIYAFWGNKGQMSFVVRNKLNVPIYIDWKKSSLVLETKTTPYYAEMEQSSFGSVTAHGNRLSVTAGNGTSVKAERISFIAPQAYIEKTFGDLSNYDVITLSKGSGKPAQYHGVAVIEHKLSKPTLPFRNFISYSTTEDFKVECYVNNGFYVDEILLLKKKDLGQLRYYANQMDYFVSDQKDYHTMPYFKWEIYRK